MPELPLYYLLEKVRIHDFHRFGCIPANPQVRAVFFGGPVKGIARQGVAAVEISASGPNAIVSGQSQVKEQRTLCQDDGRFFDESTRKYYALHEILQEFSSGLPTVIARFESLLAGNETGEGTAQMTGRGEASASQEIQKRQDAQERDQPTHRRDELKRSMWSEIERTLDAKIDRYLSVGHQGLIACHHFAHASHECLLLYRDGYFISCIMVAQAVSDGILKFVADRNNIQQLEKKTKQSLGERMQEAGIVTEVFVEAFERIQGSFRNDFHHMNPPVATVDLAPLAERNVKDLTSLEREIFAFSTDDGRLVPKNPKYWDVQPDGSVLGYVRR